MTSTHRGETVRLTTAQAILKYFGAQHTSRDGVETPLIGGVFGIFGHGNGAGFGHALATGSGALRYHQGKNEQAMVHAAIGYARTHNLASTLAVTTSLGPGATNLVTGAATATVNRVPVLLLPGDVFASRRQGPILQGMEMPQDFGITANDALRPVSRYFDRITRPEQIIQSLPHATAALLDHANAGAVTVAVCQDVQAQAYDFPVDLFKKRVHLLDRVAPTSAALAAAVEAITASKRPFIISGGGVRYSLATDALAELSNTAGIPVAESLAGRGSGHGVELNAGGMGFIGSPAANKLAAEADLVISVGSRLADTITGSHTLFQGENVQFLNINLSRHDLPKMGAIEVCADAKAALETLTQALADRSYKTSEEWVSRAQEVIQDQKTAIHSAVSEPRDVMAGFEVVADVAAATTPQDRVVFSSSTAIGHAHATWDSKTDGTLDFEYGFSCMGYELPAALGAVLSGKVEGHTIAVIGDGTYLMAHASELVTAIQEGVSFTTIVLVNNGWQCIRSFQEGAFGEEFGTQFRLRDGDQSNLTGPVVTVDHAGTARSYGAEAYDVYNRDELRAALDKARNASGPVVIAAHTSTEDLPFGAEAWWEFGSPDADAPEGLAPVRERFLEAAQNHLWYV